MRKPHRKQRLAWLLTAALLLTHLPVSVLSEEIIENPIQTEIIKQDESETVEDPNLPDSPTEETSEPTEPPVSEEPDETPEPSEPSGTMEIPADENTPDIPDQDESETPEPSDSDIEETPSPEVPEEMPDTGSTDEPPAEEVPAEETPIPEESPLPDDEEAFSVWQRPTLTRANISGSPRSRTPSCLPIRRTSTRTCCAPTRWSSLGIRRNPARGATNT